MVKRNKKEKVDFSSIHQLLEDDKNRRRSEWVINKLLDEWYDQNPDSYDEYWEENKKGIVMLEELEEDYPEFYYSILQKNMVWIYKEYEVY